MELREIILQIVLGKTFKSLYHDLRFSPQGKILGEFFVYIFFNKPMGKTELLSVKIIFMFYTI